MKSTAKKQTVYYHVTQFGNAANIMKTGLLKGSQISFKERRAHLNAGIVSRGYYVSLARSLVSEYIVDNMRRGGETFCVLMIDTERIRGRFKLEPIDFYGNYKYKTREQSSEYEERLIFDSKALDVSNAIVGIVLLAAPDYDNPSQQVVRIPRKFFPFIAGKELFYVTAKNFVKRPLNLKVKSGSVTLSEAMQYISNGRDTTKNFKVLTTPLKDVASLPAKDLAKYILHSFVMVDNTLSSEYHNQKVYDHINQIALRNKTQPEMVMRNMLDISTKEFSRRANSLLKEYVGLFATVVKRARRAANPQDAFKDPAYELNIFVRVLDRLRKPVTLQKFVELEQVYYNTRDVLRYNKPKEMSELRRSTTKLKLESSYTRPVFHDDQEFDFDSLKDFVFEDSPNLREVLAPYIDALYK